MQDYQWITFDCYGTLIDWEHGITASFERTAKLTGSTFDPAKILYLYSKYEASEEMSYKKYREVLNRVARRICLELGYKVEDYTFLSESLARWRPFADTNVALERLARHYKLGILSNVDQDLLNETRKHFTVPFQLIVTADQVASYKPDPRHFMEARKKIKDAKWIHAAQSFYHDVIPCSRLGIDVAWINRKQETPKDSNFHPIFNRPSISAFADWMEGFD
ncbi:MAG TPA: HAD-IA family hydrolase [Acidobacteriota bacterium]|nr:HAD-IA family hydrolase [Acidobacteriota bacterium]